MITEESELLNRLLMAEQAERLHAALLDLGSIARRPERVLEAAWAPLEVRELMEFLERSVESADVAFFTAQNALRRALKTKAAPEYEWILLKAIWQLLLRMEEDFRAAFAAPGTLHVATNFLPELIVELQNVQEVSYDA